MDPSRRSPLLCRRFWPVLLQVPALLLVFIVWCVFAFGNPQWRHRYIYRHLPWTRLKASIDDDAAMRQLQQGMTRREVLEQLGQPVGLTGCEVETNRSVGEGGFAYWCYSWSSDRSYFYVYFGPDDRMEGCGVQ